MSPQALLVRRMQALIVFNRRWNGRQCALTNQTVYATLDTRDLQAVLVLTLPHLATQVTRARTEARATRVLLEHTNQSMDQERARIVHQGHTPIRRL